MRNLRLMHSKTGIKKSSQVKKQWRIFHEVAEISTENHQDEEKIQAGGRL